MTPNGYGSSSFLLDTDNNGTDVNGIGVAPTAVSKRRKSHTSLAVILSTILDVIVFLAVSVGFIIQVYIYLIYIRFVWWISCQIVDCPNTNGSIDFHYTIALYITYFKLSTGVGLFKFCRQQKRRIVDNYVRNKLSLCVGTLLYDDEEDDDYWHYYCCYWMAIVIE